MIFSMLIIIQKTMCFKFMLSRGTSEVSHRKENKFRVLIENTTLEKSTNPLFTKKMLKFTGEV